MSESSSPNSSPGVTRSLAVVGLGTLVTAIVAAIWGWASGDFVGSI